MTLEEFLEEEKELRKQGQTVFLDEVRKIFNAESELSILTIGRRSSYNDEGYELMVKS